MAKDASNNTQAASTKMLMMAHASNAPLVDSCRTISALEISTV